MRVCGKAWSSMFLGHASPQVTEHTGYCTSGSIFKYLHHHATYEQLLNTNILNNSRVKDLHPLVLPHCFKTLCWCPECSSDFHKVISVQRRPTWGVKRGTRQPQTSGSLVTFFGGNILWLWFYLSPSRDGGIARQLQDVMPSYTWENIRLMLRSAYTHSYLTRCQSNE